MRCCSALGFPESQDNSRAAGSAFPGMLDSIWHCLPVNSTPPKQPGSVTVCVGACVCVCLSTRVHWPRVSVGVCICVYMADCWRWTKTDGWPGLNKVFQKLRRGWKICYYYYFIYLFFALTQKSILGNIHIFTQFLQNFFATALKFAVNLCILHQWELLLQLKH